MSRVVVPPVMVSGPHSCSSTDSFEGGRNTLSLFITVARFRGFESACKSLAQVSVEEHRYHVTVVDRVGRIVAIYELQESTVGIQRLHGE